MSGGIYDYIGYRVREMVGKMHDAEMDALIKDVAEVLHDLEWWDSDDCIEETYRETVREFKRKWFGTENADRIERIARICADKCDEMKKELLEMINSEM